MPLTNKQFFPRLYYIYFESLSTWFTFALLDPHAVHVLIMRNNNEYDKDT